MAITNHERVGKVLELLKAGLGPFVEREVKGPLESRRLDAFKLRDYAEDAVLANKPVSEWDVAGLLKLTWETWNDVFRRILGPAERGLVGELRGHRSKWAHQESFSSDDAYRALDSAGRLLAAVSAPQSEELERLKMELLRVRFDEQARGERRRQAASRSRVLPQPVSNRGGRSSRPTRMSRADATSRPSSRPTSGRCIWVKGRTSTGTRSSSFGELT